MDPFIIFYVLIGVVIGSVTGLIPGFHPNTVAIIFLNFIFTNSFNSSITLISVAVTHSFVDFIPSVFFGAPDPDTALSILPGHKMLMSGNAYKAIKLTVMGGIISLIIILILLPVFVFTIEKINSIISPVIPWILILISMMMFLKDRNVWSIVIFTLSGMLGYITLSHNMLGNFTLLPLLTGLFGISTLIKSLMDKTEIPEQRKTDEQVDKVLRGGFIGTLAGILVGFLPGVGAAQATFISKEVVRSDEENFMIAIGGVNTSVTVFSIIVLWLIGKTRTGITVAISELVDFLTLSDVVVLLGSVLLAGGLAAIITLKLAKLLLNFFRKIDYMKLNLVTIIFLTSITFFFTGFLGIFILFISASIGMVCILSGTKRSYMMASIILPTIINLI